jgi:hypothetical protein
MFTMALSGIEDALHGITGFPILGNYADVGRALRFCGAFLEVAVGRFATFIVAIGDGHVGAFSGLGATIVRSARIVVITEVVRIHARGRIRVAVCASTRVGVGAA